MLYFRWVTFTLYYTLVLCFHYSIITNHPGGLGDMEIPIVSDLTRQISRDYGVMLEDEGHTLRGLFIIDDKGKLH